MIIVKLTPARVALVIAACVAIVAGASYAAIPAANGTISACVKQNGEIQKLMDTEAGDTCTGNNKKVVTWSQQGPAGPQGSAGGQRVSDRAGHSRPISDSRRQGEVRAFCPAGTKPLGGGGQRLQAHRRRQRDHLLERDLRREHGQLARKRLVRPGPESSTPNSEPWGIKVYAICATVAS